jgi:Rnl2 family RNA ligase
MSASPDVEFPDASSVIRGGSDFWSFPSFDAIGKGVARMQKLAPEVCEKAIWQAVEKVHGSNFSVTYGEGEMTPLYASRSQYLSASFFNHTVVLKPMLPAMEAVVKAVRGENGNQRVQFFGEMFGGGVQKSNYVFYTPEPTFAAFDLFVGGDAVNRDEMFELFEAHGVPYIKPAARGKLADLLKMNPAFESEVYKMYGHAKPDHENLAEGYVLQPVEPVTVIFSGEPVRIMLKHKNPTHSEVTVKLAKPVKPAASKEAPALDSLPADVKALIEKAVCFITLSRLGSVLSKTGEYEPSARAKTLGAFVQDAFVDLQKELVDSADEKALLMKQQKVIRPFMLAEANVVLDAYIDMAKK